ncbi:MAG: M20 family metallopeptidase [Planctomycetota bacterium]|nr:M20 family metallopeptidase [Planctomycetota bacterium]
MSPTELAKRLDPDAVSTFVERVWEDEIVPELIEYIRIPNKSPMFDPDWAEHGYMEQATQQIARWCEGREIEGLSVEVVRLEGRTPLIVMEIPAFGGGDPEDTVLLYGHLDKQPEMVGWREDLGPWIPKREGDKLYGRGGADDGYAAYASLTAIEAVQRHGGSHSRLIVLIEACEESGSFDLPPYLEHLGERIGQPSLVVCLDSGCGNYDQLWCTTSLRGIVMAEVTAEILTEGVHSGDASGVVPSSFRIARQLLSRLEDEDSGEIKEPAFHVDIPDDRREQAEIAGEVLGETTWRKFPFVEGAEAMEDDPTQLVLNRTWRPFVEITAADGIPSLTEGGNVLRPVTTLKISARIPPTCDADAAAEALEVSLLEEPPYGAKLSVSTGGQPGWNAPPIAPWLEAALGRASDTYFGKPAVYMGEGGTIPFMGMLGEQYPEAQFLITGVLGPASNAHGPNEFLHIPTGKRLTSCVAQVLCDHAARTSS